MHIDLNCDMGEIPTQIADGTQESLMRSITSVNIACGGHAGDDDTMKTTIEQALRWNLTIGAHPGYPDRANFGRLEMDLPLSEIETTIFAQIHALSTIAATFATSIVHVKPHGALYNQAVNRSDLAGAIARGVARFSKDVVLVGLAGSPMLDAFRAAGFRVAAEAFADRRYEPDGTLRSRKFDDALIRDPRRAAEQALGIARKQGVIASDGSTVKIDAQTICIHGDTPGAPQIEAAVARALRAAGIALRSLMPSGRGHGNRES
jgi:5-oxoprolinase (ATP-hydrolysing) subunit A